MSFKGIQKTLSFTQTNHGSIEQVFPLLCPVRELDWLDGWNFKMIYSESGLIEENCVFTTPHHGEQETVWHVTKHDKKNFVVEFVRVTPGENVVKIFIALTPLESNTTRAEINYQYTALSEKQNEYINSKLKEDFTNSMRWWEKAINYYLTTGKKLMKTII